MPDKKGGAHPAKTKSVSGAVKVLLILFTTGILTLGGFTGYKLFAGNVSSPEKDTTPKRNYVVLADADAVPPASEEEVNSASSYDVKMNSEWTFDNGRAYSKDAFVENPSSNLNSVYFDIKVNGYEEPVFTSPVLPVGSHIENITLDKELKAGKYNCTLTYHLLSMDGKDSVGTLQMALKITVKGG